MWNNPKMEALPTGCCDHCCPNSFPYIFKRHHTCLSLWLLLAVRRAVPQCWQASLKSTGRNETAKPSEWSLLTTTTLLARAQRACVSFNTVAGLRLLTCSSSLTPLSGDAGRVGKRGPPRWTRWGGGGRGWKNKHGDASATSQLPLAWIWKKL